MVDDAKDTTRGVLNAASDPIGTAGAIADQVGQGVEDFIEADAEGKADALGAVTANFVPGLGQLGNVRKGAAILRAAGKLDDAADAAKAGKIASGFADAPHGKVDAPEGGALVPKGAKPLGDWGETRLKNLLGGKGSKTNFSTSTGRREVDRLVDRVAHESKAGINVKPTSPTRRQIAKDKELIDTGQIDGAHWHFWQGADQSLLDELTQNGIDFTVH